MELVFYFLVGMFAGVMGALLGLGGGVVIVPFLVFFAKQEPWLAIGTSTFVVLLNAISGTIGYLREHKVYLEAGITFALATIPGAFLGSYASEYLQGKLFHLVFGIFFVGVAAQLFYKAGGQSKSSNEEVMPTSFNRPLGIACSVCVGFLASILGIGGGIIHVPFMVYVMNFPVHVAIATSTFILAVSAISGTISHGFLGHVLWSAGLSLGLGAFIGAQLGVKLSKRVNSSVLMKLTSGMVLITGIKFIMSGL